MCIRDRLLADGCRIYDASVRECVVGLRSIIGQEASIQSSILMGADYYETDADKAENRRLKRPDIGIGPNAVIKGAIVDKNARLGSNVTIRYIPCLLYTSPSPRDRTRSRMPSSA